MNLYETGKILSWKRFSKRTLQFGAEDPSNHRCEAAKQDEDQDNASFGLEEFANSVCLVRILLVHLYHNLDQMFEKLSRLRIHHVRGVQHLSHGFPEKTDGDLRLQGVEACRIADGCRDETWFDFRRLS